MNEFLAVVGRSLSMKIFQDNVGPVAAGEVRHWVVAVDEAGTAIADDDDTGLKPHEILGSLIERDGVRGAAYVTQHSGDALIAQAYLRNPSYGLNSDVRRSRIGRTLDGVAIDDEWEYTL
ncbi:MAG: hypothetical protein WKF96_20600 [Solirubrobacteraceae bacterium]